METVFFTKYGKSWFKEASSDNPISNETRKLLQSTGHYKKGFGYYTLRHVFETIGGGAGNGVEPIHVDFIMGHVDPGMASTYREKFYDEKLKPVTDHIHDWLFGKPIVTLEDKVRKMASEYGISEEKARKVLSDDQ